MNKFIGLSVGNATIQVLIHKDNAGALVLSKSLLLQITPQSKHYHIKRGDCKTWDQDD